MSEDNRHSRVFPAQFHEGFYAVWRNRVKGMYPNGKSLIIFQSLKYRFSILSFMLFNLPQDNIVICKLKGNTKNNVDTMRHKKTCIFQNAIILSAPLTLTIIEIYAETIFENSLCFKLCLCC